MTGISVRNNAEERRLSIDQGQEEVCLRICAAVLDSKTNDLLVVNNGGSLDLPGGYVFEYPSSFEKVALDSLSRVFPFTRGRVLGWKNKDISLRTSAMEQFAQQQGMTISPLDVELFHWVSMCSDLPVTRLFVGDRPAGKVLATFVDSQHMTGLIFIYSASLDDYQYSGEGGRWELCHSRKGQLSAQARAAFCLIDSLRKSAEDSNKCVGGAVGKGTLSDILF